MIFNLDRLRKVLSVFTSRNINRNSPVTISVSVPVDILPIYSFSFAVKYNSPVTAFCIIAYRDGNIIGVNNIWLTITVVVNAGGVLQNICKALGI